MAMGERDLLLPGMTGGALPAGMTMVSWPSMFMDEGIDEGGVVVGGTGISALGAGIVAIGVGNGVGIGCEMGLTAGMGALSSGTSGSRRTDCALRALSCDADSFGRFDKYFVGSSFTQPCVMAHLKNIRKVESLRLIVADGVWESICERL